VLGRLRSSTAEDRRRWWPLAFVAFAVIFNLVVLRPELRTASNVNDNALHLQMIKWASHEIGEGRAPLDGWYPSLGLGSAQFRQYNSTPHRITGAIARVTGADRAMRLTLYLLLALWPLSVFWGARLLGWGRWASGAAALVSPLVISTPGYGFEHASYVWRGFGLWSQAWAMWSLPIALGLSWRAVSRGRSYAVAALAVAVTIAFHMFEGYLALIAIGIWALLKRGEIRRRVGRAALVGIGSLAAAAWVLVPLVTGSRWIINTSFARGTFWNDSFGARKVLGWLFTGQLFDAGRFPIVTILVGVGGGVCVAKFRRGEPARAVLGLFVASLLLFFGRPTLGPLLDLLPGSADLQLNRFIFGVQLAGIILAGVGIAWLARSLVGVVRRVARQTLPASVAALLSVAILIPGWTHIASYQAEGSRWISTQRLVDTSDGADVGALIEEAKSAGDGRIYAGMRSGWGKDYKVGSVPVFAMLMEQAADAVGYTLRVWSLSTDIEPLFDDTNLAQYELLNVRYLILPEDRDPPVKATLLNSRGRHRLWKVQTTGYAQLIDTTTAITADRRNLAERLGWFLRSAELERHLHPLVAFDGAGAPAPTVVGKTGPQTPPGNVTGVDRPSNGTYAVSVVAQRDAVLMLKTSFDPGWHAFVDGRETPTQMVAPSFVGVPVPAGNHVVVFRYRGFGSYPALIAVGLLALIGLAQVSRRAGAGGRRSSHPAIRPSEPNAREGNEPLSSVTSSDSG
jgi:membrane protein YfhO